MLKKRGKIKAAATVNCKPNANSPQKFYLSTDLPIKLSSNWKDINYIRCKVNWKKNKWQNCHSKLFP